jgi:hypothetical protein
MNLTDKRTAIIDVLQLQLPTTKWFPFLPSGLKSGSGWLVLTEISSEGMPFQALRATFNAVLALGTDLKHAQTQGDLLIVAFHDACMATECWGIVATLDTITIGGADFYVLTATLMTEVESS